MSLRYRLVTLGVAGELLVTPMCHIDRMHVSISVLHVRKRRLVVTAHDLEHAAMAGDAVRGDGRAHFSRRARFARHDSFVLPISNTPMHQKALPYSSPKLLCSSSLV